MNRVGIFGGSFDPPHVAHQILAEWARDALSLDCVLWVPVGDQPLKAANELSPVSHRVAMVERAIRGNPGFGLSRVDVDRPGPHYTSAMMDIIARENPAAALVLIIGSDSLRDLAEWHNPQQIVERASLAVVERPGATYDLVALEAQIPGLTRAVQRVEAPLFGVSATDIRSRVEAGRSIRYLVSQAVEAYIDEHALYRKGNR